MGDFNYGYRDREDLADRFVESQVTEPPRTQARSVGSALRGSSSGGATAQVVAAPLEAVIGIGRLWLGPQVYGAELRGTGTASVTAGGWHATLLRHSNLVAVRATAGNDKQYYSNIRGADWSPRLLLNPGHPPMPVIIRFEDVVGFDIANPAAGRKGYMMFGLVRSDFALVAADPKNFLGFMANANGVANGEWRALVSNNTTTTRSTTLTGYTTDTPRLLTLEIDGWLKQIKWLVDGVEVDTWAPGGTDTPEPTTNLNTWPSWVVGSVNDADVNAVTLVDGQGVLAVRNLDETGA